MYHLVLITALSTTTGLFGGGKHCGKSHHGKRAVVASCYSSKHHGAVYAAPYTTPQAVSVPSAQAYPMAPSTPAKMAPPALVVPPAPPAPSPSSANVAPPVATGGIN